MTFDWKFQQSTYPYVSDSGTGEMSILNSLFSSNLESIVNFRKQCMEIIFNSPEFVVNEIKLEIDGGSSYLYEALKDAIEEQTVM